MKVDINTRNGEQVRVAAVPGVNTASLAIRSPRANETVGALLSIDDLRTLVAACESAIRDIEEEVGERW